MKQALQLMQIILVVTNVYICVKGNLCTRRKPTSVPGGNPPVYAEETHLCTRRKPTCQYPEETHLSVPGGNPPLTLCP